MLYIEDKPQIVKTTQTYTDGVLVSSTAWASTKRLNWIAIVQGIVIAVVVFHQWIMT